MILFVLLFVLVCLGGLFGADLLLAAHRKTVRHVSGCGDPATPACPILKRACKQYAEGCLWVSMPHAPAGFTEDKTQKVDISDFLGNTFFLFCSLLSKTTCCCGHHL